MSGFRIIEGNALAHLAELDAGSVQTCITSPPYWGLRDYGNDGQHGLEPTPEEYVANLVAVFREVRRVLRSDGTFWLNLGDSYAGGGGYSPGSPSNVARQERLADGDDRDGAFVVRGEHNYTPRRGSGRAPTGLKSKDLVGIPWMVAFALRADGWYLRSDIIWSKPNPMPESVTDRPTKAHEYLFLLSKSPHYFYDADAIREEAPERVVKMPDGWDTGPGGHGTIHRDGREKGRPANAVVAGRNKRSVWTVTTQPYPGAHFATFPPKLIEPCILAGSPPKCCGECGAPWERVIERESLSESEIGRRPHRYDGRTNPDRNEGGAVRAYVRSETLGWRPTCSHGSDKEAMNEDQDRSRAIVGRARVFPNGGVVAHGEEGDDAALSGSPVADRVEAGRSVVLDPFAGAGTTGVVALRHNRDFIGIELNPEYAEMARRRIYDDAPLLNLEVA